MLNRKLEFGPHSPFDPEERNTISAFWDFVRHSSHEKAEDYLETVQAHVHRTDGVGAALLNYPPVFREKQLGPKRRSVSTLVDLLATATDANFEMFLPTRALVGRSLLMAELNTWRLLHLICQQIFGEPENLVETELHPIHAQVHQWLHGCVHTKLTEEVLGSICMDGSMERRIRIEAVRSLVHLWENRLTYRVRNFFPLLEATWNARRRIRVSVGTRLGVSEIFRLIQAGCPDQFMEYFSRPFLTKDEQEAFQEFLMGVSTEKLQTLEQWLQEQGRTSISPEEAPAEIGHVAPRDLRYSGVRAYEFYRGRYLQAAARRLKNLPGPKKTAEEYVMIYFLDQETRQPQGVDPRAGAA
ncbi:MAG: hypothetical protein DWQ01_14595 [Planctomycetota bacterium]|nr:MAG: hypothetical protein DWQ01_14595 [Planctomycetota bacterium]